MNRNTIDFKLGKIVGICQILNNGDQFELCDFVATVNEVLRGKRISIQLLAELCESYCSHTQIFEDKYVGIGEDCSIGVVSFDLDGKVCISSLRCCKCEKEFEFLELTEQDDSSMICEECNA